MNLTSQTLLSLLHNGLSVLAGVLGPLAINAASSAITGSPFLQANPDLEAAAAGILTFVTRDLLKNVPAFAGAAGTATPASAAVSTTSTKK